MICRRCGHEHSGVQCPLCGQPQPDQIATPEQRRAYRQRLHVTVVLPRDSAATVEPLLALASHRHQEGDRVLATYREDALPNFLKLWDAIGVDPRCELLFNGQRRPFDRELWIPLIWLAALAEDPEPQA